MNYEDMSDFEINAAVTCIVHECHGWEINWTNSCFFHCGVDGSGYYSQSIADYCNNPSDAWPIIKEIWVELMSPPYRGFGPLWDNTVVKYNCGKLRAAMICFLKKKDAEK